MSAFDIEARRCGICEERGSGCDCLFCPGCGDLVARDAAWEATTVAPAVRFCSTECLTEFGGRGWARGLVAMRVTGDGTLRLREVRG